ncbi:translation initiation factor eIF-2B subunit gamma, partial [Lecanoromycetidae sp. Uapishka_2]
MPHALSVPFPGFQAVVLCGPGVSLNTFTANAEEFPKALVPIANRPMVWYPLDWCYRMGITRALKWDWEERVAGGEEVLAFGLRPKAKTTAVPPPEGSLRPHISKLLYATTTDTLRDITQEQKGFPIRHGLIRKHGKIRMLMTHRDAHIYLFPHWVLELIKTNDTFDSISEDVVGWWAKASWQDGLADKLGLREILHPSSVDEHRDGESGSHASGNIEDDIDLASISTLHTSTLRPLSSKAPKTKGNSPLSIPPMLSYVHRTQSPMIRRVDTPHLLLHTSLYVATLPPTTDPPAGSIATPLSHTQKISTDASLIAPSTNIHAPTTLIAPNTTIATHAVIKTSVIGANCVIEAGARLTGCLLMDGVTVGEKAVLQGCILGRRSVVGSGANLKECEVQEGYKVQDLTEGKGEKYMVFEGLEEGVEVNDDEEGDMDEGMMLPDGE